MINSSSATSSSTDSSSEDNTTTTTEDESSYIPFPGKSSYRKTCYCCSTVAVGSTRKYYWGNWNIHYSPIIIILLSLWVLIVHFVYTMLYTSYFGYIFTPIILLALIFFYISYFSMIFVGPGYLPYYWYHANEKLIEYISTEDNFEGMAISQKQVNWMRFHIKPPRCYNFDNETRFVIRPSHFCTWAGVYVGKRNTKLFLLTTIYAFLYCFLMIISHSVTIIMRRSTLSQYNETFIIICIPIEFFVMLYPLYQFSRTIAFAARNTTKFEAAYGVPTDYYDTGDMKKNYEEVFGGKQCCCCYALPIDPFYKISNNDLISNQKPYPHIDHMDKML